MRPPTRSLLILFLGLMALDVHAATRRETTLPGPRGPRRPPARSGLAAVVGGQDHAVREIEEAIRWRTTHAETVKRFGGQPPGGFLLIGPPGNGKTALARGVAQQLGAEFLELAGPEVQEHYTGDSEKKLRDLFQKAERLADDGKPVVIFMDEIDILAVKRTPDSREFQTGPAMQLAVLMDGVKARKNVIVMAATNRPNAIDPAFRRPGRFDREITIRLPDARGRAEVLGVHTAAMPLANDVDLFRIAHDTVGFSGADMAHLAQSAGMRAAARAAGTIDRLLARGPNPRDVAAYRTRIVKRLKAVGGDRAVSLAEREYARFAEERGAAFTDAWTLPAYLEARAELIETLPEDMRTTFDPDQSDRQKKWQFVGFNQKGELQGGLIGYRNVRIEGDEQTAWAGNSRTLGPNPYVDPRPDKVRARERVTQADLKAARAAMEPSLVREFALEVPHVRWQDVGGNERAKTEMRRILETPASAYKKLGLTRPGGILLYGPPGTGKSLLAKAAATATRRPILTIKASDILSAYHGQSNQQLADLLDRASAVAPSVLLIDELDSLFARRGGGLGDYGSKTNDQLVGELLSWMDGLTAQRDVLLIATTNRPDAIDPGLRRPGRFDAQVYVGMPTEDERASIFRAQARTLHTAPTIDWKALAARATRRSGADIMSIVQKAALNALNERAPMIGMAHLERAIEATPPSINADDLAAYEEYEAGRTGEPRKNPIGFSR